jgi:hypothetical protein
MEEQKPLEGYSGIKPVVDEETALSKMSPAQKEQLEKMKALYQERMLKIHNKYNLKQMAQDKAAKKRKKAEKVARKQRKINRRKKK